jgi:hypothetical protein
VCLFHSTWETGAHSWGFSLLRFSRTDETHQLLLEWRQRQLEHRKPVGPAHAPITPYGHIKVPTNRRCSIAYVPLTEDHAI